MYNIKGFIYVNLFSLFWAIQVIINKFAINKGVEPITFIYLSLFVAALITFVYSISTKNFKLIKKKDIPLLTSVGFLGTGLATIAAFYGLKYSTVVNFGFLIKSTMIFSMILAFIFLNEKITFEKVIYLLMLLFGAYLISTDGKLIIPHIGDLIILLSALCLSAAAVISKPLLNKYPPEIITFYRVLVGGIMLLAMLPLISGSFMSSEIVLVILRGVVVFLTTLFFSKAVKVSSISYVTLMSMMFSIFTAILGYICFNETMSGIQMIGGSNILFAVILIQRSIR